MKHAPPDAVLQIELTIAMWDGRLQDVAAIQRKLVEFYRANKREEALANARANELIGRAILRGRSGPRRAQESGRSPGRAARARRAGGTRAGGDRRHERRPPRAAARRARSRSRRQLVAAPECRRDASLRPRRRRQVRRGDRRDAEHPERRRAPGVHVLHPRADSGARRPHRRCDRELPPRRRCRARPRHEHDLAVRASCACAPARCQRATRLARTSRSRS